MNNKTPAGILGSSHFYSLSQNSTSIIGNRTLIKLPNQFVPIRYDLKELSYLLAVYEHLYKYLRNIVSDPSLAMEFPKDGTSVDNWLKFREIWKERGIIVKLEYIAERTGKSLSTVKRHNKEFK